MKSTSLSDKLFGVFVALLLSLLVVCTLYPLIYVAIASVSDGGRLMAHQGLLWKPLGFNLSGYERVLGNKSIYTGYMNTLIIVITGVVLNVAMTTAAAFVLSRKQVMWNSFFMFFIVFTMFFSGGLIPLYLIVKGAGLTNTLASVILPFAMNTFHLIIMRTSFQAIPETLEESAKIDGAHHLTILLRIVIPLSMPVIAVVILYAAVDRWNAWFYASVFLKDRSLYPLQLILRELLISDSTDTISTGAVNELHQIGETIKYASIMVATLPILFIYPFLQKHFVKGVMIGALKG
ncbi:carbohydrate ABC transporter permease [Paenibacillus filicis]|uniref:Carbohydrate ABC transporter permease n=1 Tax=Paenibacillus filicis TaxID=669464 RepID=A0ABU9DMW1_9BACL